MTTIRQMLTEIPDLAAEAWITKDAPNPATPTQTRPRLVAEVIYRERPVVSCSNPSDQTPANLAVLDVLRVPGEDDTQGGPLWGLTQAVRVMWEGLQREGEQTPVRAEAVTWGSECGWMLACLDSWQAICDEVEWAMVESCVRQAWQALRRVVRAPEPPRLTCRVYGCGGRIEVQSGEVEGVGNPEVESLVAWSVAAQCEHGHDTNRAAEERRHQRSYPRPLPQIATESGIPLRTLQDWAKKGKIRPHGAVDGVAIYRPDEVEQHQLARKAGLAR